MYEYYIMSGTLSLTFNISAAPFLVELPITGSGVAVSIDWGDSTTDSLLTHTYATNATFTAVVTITAGSVTAFGADFWTGVGRLTAVATSNTATWGLPGVTSFAYAFRAADILTSVPTQVPLNVTNMSDMFNFTPLFNQDISGWNVSNVTNMSRMFRFAYVFNQNISGWNVSNVTNMSRMFEGTGLFNQNISSWNVSNVVDMSNMFRETTAFNNGGAALTWSTGTGTSRVQDMSFMFRAANAFNQDISSWDVSSVTDMNSMFNGANAFNQDITLWNVSAVQFMNQMFANNSAFNNGAVGDVGGKPLTWTTSLVTNFTSMFFSATAFNQYVSSWNVSSAINIQSIFHGATKFNNGAVGDLGGKPLTWTTTSLNNMNSMFANATAFNQDITSWNVSSVLDMTGMFNNANKFNNGAVGNVGGKPLTWTTTSLNSMAGMFGDASRFNQDISGWNVSGVTNMRGTFENCFIFDQDIRIWVVGSGTNLTDMFLGSTAMTSTYGSVPGYGNTPLYTFFTGPPPPYPCFLEGSQILCFKNNKEVYRPVESLRKGDLVKTICHGYLPVHMIGTSPMYNPNDDNRIASRLYRCPKENYPGLFEDLYITGCHSILVPWLTYEQGQKTIDSLGRLFVTDNHCRLMAWVDEKAVPYKMEGVYNIYHIALENEDYYMNYGIYANGLLVESCSKRYLIEISNMRILGEEDTSVAESSVAEENVFCQISSLIETC